MMSILITLILAASAPVEPASHVFVGQLVAGLIALGTLGTLFGFQLGKRRITIDPQPLQVRLEEHFVTRREHDKLEAYVMTTAARMEGLFTQTMAAVEQQGKTTGRRIENQNERLTESIREVAKAAYDGRSKLWTKVNEKSEDLAKLEAKTDVAREIGKLGEGLIAAIEKTKDGHGS